MEAAPAPATARPVMDLHTLPTTGGPTVPAAPTVRARATRITTATWTTAATTATSVTGTILALRVTTACTAVKGSMARAGLIATMWIFMEDPVALRVTVPATAAAILSTTEAPPRTRVRAASAPAAQTTR